VIHGLPRLVALSTEVYARLLRTLPATFRDAYAPSMVLDFRDLTFTASRDHATPGLLAIWPFWNARARKLAPVIAGQATHEDLGPAALPTAGGAPARIVLVIGVSVLTAGRAPSLAAALSPVAFSAVAVGSLIAGFAGQIW
jgi:hypothetical protein